MQRVADDERRMTIVQHLEELRRVLIWVLASWFVGTAIAFVVAYASVAWLLRFVAGHKISAFVPYRVAAGIVIIILLAVGTL